MQKLNVDIGVREFQIGEGVLRFNPSDPNVYQRFMEALPKVEAVEQELVEKARQIPHDENNGKEALRLMAEADTKTKALLDEVFTGNSFDAIVDGVNLMAVAGNGERVITNLLAALQPIIQQGAKRFYDQKAGEAVAAAKANRQQRRAAGKGRCK